jgi:hypothetical protein
VNVRTETPVIARKPVVRPVGTGDHTFAVQFGCGGRAEIYKCERHDGTIGWGGRVLDDAGETKSQISIPSYRGDGLAESAEKVLAAAAVEAFREESVPAWGTAAEVHELAKLCDDDRTLLTKTIKQIARARFGVKLNARGSRGTGYGWVHVSSSSRGKPTIAERIAISVIDGRSSGDASIRPCGGARVAVICHLAGHPLPEGFKVRAPQWD